jgi:hypothetical protein
LNFRNIEIVLSQQQFALEPMRLSLTEKDFILVCGGQRLGQST